MSGMREELQRLQLRLEDAGLKGPLLHDVMARIKSGEDWQMVAEQRFATIRQLTELVPPERLPKPYRGYYVKRTGD